jgi:hypothetical protein
MGKKGKSLKSIDIYGETKGFNFGGEGSFQTYLGLCLTLFTLFIFVAYSLHRVNALVTRDDTVTRSTISYDSYDTEKVTSIDDIGLNLAFGIAKTNGESQELLSDYFDLQVFIETTDVSGGVFRQPVQTTACPEEIEADYTAP